MSAVGDKAGTVLVSEGWVSSLAWCWLDFAFTNAVQLHVANYLVLFEDSD